MRVVVIEDEEEIEENTHLEDDEDEEVQPLPLVEVTCRFPYPNPYPKGVRYKWCDFCDRKFHTENGIRRHMLADHPKQNRKKEIEDENRTTIDENRTTIQCSLCNFSSKTSLKYAREALKRHMQKEHKEEEAQKQEAERAKLRMKREEELQKAKAGVILCRSCHFQANPLSWRNSMKKHMEEEHENQVGLLILQFSDEVEGGKYSCRLCSRYTSSLHPPYRNSEVLRQHLKRKHGVGRAPLPCPVCAKLVGHTASLKRHMKEHTTHELKRAAGH